MGTAPILYSASGARFKFEVYKPETGTKYYVRKKTLSGGHKIGTDAAFGNEAAAKRNADNRAENDVKPRKGLI